jgi:hypothetical protein
MGRVCLYEVWYRRWEPVIVLIAAGRPGRGVRPGQRAARHRVAKGIKPSARGRAHVRVLLDGPAQALRRPARRTGTTTSPTCSSWGKLEDRTGVPYGAVKAMVYLQDNVNSTQSKIRWGLSSVRTDPHQGRLRRHDAQFRKMVSRVDADIVLNAEHMAKPGAKFEVERDFQLRAAVQDAGRLPHRASARLGHHASFEGQTGTATSGVQETHPDRAEHAGVASLMDNFKFGRTKVGELLLSMIIEDTIGKQETVVDQGLRGAQVPTRPSQLNVPAVDEDTGIKYLTNDVERVRLKVAMNDVPSTPSFRSQQLAAMSEAFKSMPQEFQVVALPHLLQLMDVPDRDEREEQAHWRGLHARRRSRCGRHHPPDPPQPGQPVRGRWARH